MQVLVSAILCLLLILSVHPAPLNAQGTPSYVPGELLVEYAPSVVDSVQRILSTGGFTNFFIGAEPDLDTGIVPGSTLDALHNEFGLHYVKCRFIERANFPAEDALAAQASFYASLTARYPKRSRRGDSTKFPDLTNSYLLNFDPAADMEALASQYQEDPAVLISTPNYYLGTLHSCPPSFPACLMPPPDDPFLSSCGSHGTVGLSDQWGVYNTELPVAWCSATGAGTGGADDIIVAVMDSGTDYTHHDLYNRLWTNTSEDLNNLGTFEPWPSTVACGVCAGGAGNRFRCDNDPSCNNPVNSSCPPLPSDSCNPSDQCTCVSGDLNSLDDDLNGYTDDIIGYDFYDFWQQPDPDPFDEYGHGTGVASVALATADNGFGIAGGAPGARVMTMKVTGASGTPFATLAQQESAFMYAVANGADVINMSFGSGALGQVVPVGYAAGVVLVASAGNAGLSSDPSVNKPASYPEVIAIGGTNPGGTRWAESSYGAELEVMAPAGDDEASGNKNVIIMSLAQDSGFQYNPVSAPFVIDDDHIRLRGTSFASPLTAGLVALLLSRQPSLTNVMVHHAVRNTADDILPLAFDNETGFGQINGRRALSLLRTTPALPVEVTRSTKPYSKINTAGSPPDTVQHYGFFHKPASWDINPVGVAVALKISDKNGAEPISVQIPAMCGSSTCFQVVTNPDGYKYADGSGSRGGVTQIKLVVDDAANDIWKLRVTGKNMNVDPLFQAPDLELMWSLEITGKPTLRSNIVYALSDDGKKLKYPKP